MTSQARATTMTTTTSTNRFANLWLLALSVILGLTVLCTAALVAWPLVGYISSRMFG